MTESEIIKIVIDTLSANPRFKARYSSELENFENRKVQASSNKYRLGVIGVTSSGKSTMINSLLGEMLLPAGARPSSSQLVSCFKSRNRHAEVFFNDNTSKIFFGNKLTQQIIEKYGDEASNHNNRERVKQIEISTPYFPFNEDIVLIDSPGLDAYGYDGHEQLTMNSLLPTIDFCIFVTTCKTNSDDKMLTVLNTIAEYEKPIIIVQNMIDSLKPSLDGKKSVSDVAQEHRMRLERIVNRSSIKDKSLVHIVQISAINALKARQNALRSKEDQRLFEESNYSKLVKVVETTFNSLRQAIEANRISSLKKEILRIAHAAIEDSNQGATSFIPKFEYDDIYNEYEKKMTLCLKTLDRVFGSLESEINSLKSQDSFDVSDVERIKGIASHFENEICKQMQALNSSIVNICNRLNIDSRSILTDFRIDKPELHLKTRTEVVPRGYWKKAKRKWYSFILSLFKKEDDKWIDTSYTRVVTDNEGTKQNAIHFLESCIRAFHQTISRWQNSIESTESKLGAEIANRRAEYRARVDHILDCNAYQQIGNQLQKLADSITTTQEHALASIISTKTDVGATTLYPLRIRKDVLSLYLISESIRIHLHNLTFKCLLSDRYCDINNYLIGWDKSCETRFARYAFNKTINDNQIEMGSNRLNSSTFLLHKPNNLTALNSSIKKNIFILLNAIQFGAALKDFAKLNISKILSKHDILFFVVQDFQEIINGNAVKETLENLKAIKRKKELDINGKYRILLQHDNPVFNLAAVEAQVIGCTKQSDEIKIINLIQSHFGYLLPKDRLKRNQCESTIRIIINALGDL